MIYKIRSLIWVNKVENGEIVEARAETIFGEVSVALYSIGYEAHMPRSIDFEIRCLKPFKNLANAKSVIESRYLLKLKHALSDVTKEMKAKLSEVCDT